MFPFLSFFFLISVIVDARTEHVNIQVTTLKVMFYSILHFIFGRFSKVLLVSLGAKGILAQYYYEDKV